MHIKNLFKIIKTQNVSTLLDFIFEEGRGAHSTGIYRKHDPKLYIVLPLYSYFTPLHIRTVNQASKPCLVVTIFTYNNCHTFEQGKFYILNSPKKEKKDSL